MNIVNKVTLKWLGKNKTRTIVTIIGILLSAAMITAVTTLISSFQTFMLKNTMAIDGSWHAIAYGASYEDFEQLKEMDKIDTAAVTRPVGYSMLEGGSNEYKPYLHLVELSDDSFDLLPIYLTKGRLPENDREILVSEHIKTDGDVELKIGSTIELNVGDRVDESGNVLKHDAPYFGEEENKEHIDVKETRSFTVVGEMERFPFSLEGYSAPGYTVITYRDFDELTSYSKQTQEDLGVLFTVKKPLKYYDTQKDVSEALDISLEQFKENDDVLMYMGVSNNNGFNGVLYGLGAIVIALIMVGSISLIYNSFSISVSERTKQFGLLSSVGATTKQLKHSVLFEAVVLGLIGIPLGVLSGILGIGVTLYFINNLLEPLMNFDYYFPLKLSVSAFAVISAVVIAFITILISAYRPAKRSTKISIVESIKQTTDIKLSSKQVKTSRLTRKLFGFEGDLALKNMKRNKKRYRSTVISIFISVVLFVSTSALSMYLTDSVTNVYEAADYDLYWYSSDKEGEGLDSVYDKLISLDSVKQSSGVTYIYDYDTYLTKDEMQEDFYNKFGYTDQSEFNVQIVMTVVDHSTFVDYIDDLGLDQAQFENPNQLTGVAIDKQHYYDYVNKRYVNTTIFKDRKMESLLLKLLERSADEESTAKSDQLDEVEVSIAAIAEEAPFGLSDYSNVNSVTLIIDEQSLQNFKIMPEDKRDYGYYMYFSADDPYKAETDLNEILNEANLGTVVNIEKLMQENRSIVTIISIFAYGFIILMSLITIANVFNTINTNVNLRRREFAMLKSVGMTDKSFKKMINFECILYGLKGLLYGLPVAIGVTYLIYLAVNQGVEMSFYLPTKGIIISVFSVFVVVFVSMMYSMSKIKDENIVDALKNENL